MSPGIIIEPRAILMYQFTRRSFLRWLTGALASVPGLGPLVGCFFPRRLDASERSILSAACSRILPSDDGPGATEADASSYVERALATRYHARLRPVFAEGLRSLDEIARREWKKPFVSLASDEQDRILTFVENRGEFFHRLLELTIEGFLGDPIQGGNRGEVGWSYIGYAPGTPRPGDCGERR